MRFFYWRRGRAHNANTLHVVFRYDAGEGMHVYIKPNADNTWHWNFTYSEHLQGDVATEEVARKKIEDQIGWHFRPDTAY